MYTYARPYSLAIGFYYELVLSLSQLRFAKMTRYYYIALF